MDRITYFNCFSSDYQLFSVEPGRYKNFCMASLFRAYKNIIHHLGFARKQNCILARLEHGGESGQRCKFKVGTLIHIRDENLNRGFCPTLFYLSGDQAKNISLLKKIIGETFTVILLFKRLDSNLFISQRELSYPQDRVCLFFNFLFSFLAYHLITIYSFVYMWGFVYVLQSSYNDGCFRL